MKRSLLVPLVLLGPLIAAAQSSVTLFGVADLNMTYAKVGKTSAITEGINGVSPSRLGFRGIEDLGDGYSAGFWLEGAILPDTRLGQRLGTARDIVQQVHQRDVDAQPGQRPRQREPDAPGPAGDHSDLAIEIFQHVSAPSRQAKNVIFCDLHILKSSRLVGGSPASGDRLV